MVHPDFIGIYDNALSSDKCKYIIEWIENQPLKRGGINNFNQEYQVDESVKSDWEVSNTDFSNETVIDKMIARVLFDLTPVYKQSYPEIDLIQMWDLYSNYVIQKYDPGDGYYQLHCENGGGKTINRVLAWMIYFNTVTDKGGTYFSSYDKTIEAKEGRLVIWPAYFTHFHKGVISETQKKYIATGWYGFAAD